MPVSKKPRQARAKQGSQAIVSPAPTEIGLGWYRREDWDRLVQMFPDRDQLHDTYDEWLKDVQYGEKLVKREGNITKRIIVDPDELAAWCALRGREPIASARAEYISEKMTQAAAPMPSR
jgi:hypothetical protein